MRIIIISTTNTIVSRNGNELSAAAAVELDSSERKREIHTLFHIFISVSICILIRSPNFFPSRNADNVESNTHVERQNERERKRERARKTSE
jgi:hypothetical protein